MSVLSFVLFVGRFIVKLETLKRKCAGRLMFAFSELSESVMKLPIIQPLLPFCFSPLRTLEVVNFFITNTAFYFCVNG